MKISLPFGIRHGGCRPFGLQLIPSEDLVGSYLGGVTGVGGDFEDGVSEITACGIFRTGVVGVVVEKCHLPGIIPVIRGGIGHGEAFFIDTPGTTIPHIPLPGDFKTLLGYQETGGQKAQGEHRQHDVLKIRFFHGLLLFQGKETERHLGRFGKGKVYPDSLLEVRIVFLRIPMFPDSWHRFYNRPLCYLPSRKRPVALRIVRIRSSGGCPHLQRVRQIQWRVRGGFSPRFHYSILGHSYTVFRFSQALTGLINPSIRLFRLKNPWRLFSLVC